MKWINFAHSKLAAKSDFLTWDSSSQAHWESNFVDRQQIDVSSWHAIIKLVNRDFSGSPVAENPPCNAGDEGSTPSWATKITHATEQLSHNYWSPRILDTARHD